jgi:hypothetical protein
VALCSNRRPGRRSNGQDGRAWQSAANSIVAATATCDLGLKIVGAGASLSNDDIQLVNDSHPFGTNGWSVDVLTSPVGSGPPRTRAESKAGLATGAGGDLLVATSEARHAVSPDVVVGVGLKHLLSRGGAYAHPVDAGPSPWPRFHVARGLLSAILNALLITNLEHLSGARADRPTGRS